MTNDLELLLKLRLAVARFGEIDSAGWWNTQGILGRGGKAVLSRGFPGTHFFAQARIAFAVATARCASVFAPTGCLTLWNLPADVEDAFARQWPRSCQSADPWVPFFQDLGLKKLGRSRQHLKQLGVIDDATVAATTTLRRSAEGKAVALPGTRLCEPPYADAVGCRLCQGRTACARGSLHSRRMTDAPHSSRVLR